MFFLLYSFRNYINKNSIKPSESAQIQFSLSNIGEYDGDEVVQLYIKDELASVARPIIELKGFQRIHLKQGETKTVQFEITPAMLTLLNKEMAPVVEPGDFRIMIGSSSNDIRLREILSVE